MTDERNDEQKQDHEDNLELSASLKQFRFSAGGNWKQYLGPWIGPILLVAIVGFTAFLIVVAIYSSRAILPCITFPTLSSGSCSFWYAACRPWPLLVL